MLGAKAQCQSVTMLMCSVMEWPVEEVLCIFSEIKSRWRASVRVCWRGGGGGSRVIPVKDNISAAPAA